ncbi:MAG: ATP-binding protein [Thermodesulfovibrionales bacterium]|nr:ATP-binding protein [Thermodesulfovibrionales bacterium]
MVILLFLVTILITITTYFTYKNSLTAVENSLKLHSLAIAISLESALAKIDLSKNIFTNIVTEGKWEGIAFLALYNHEGLTVIHSNEELINRTIEDTLIKKTISKKESIYSHMILGTDENIFVLNFPTEINNSLYVLRVALHRYPFEDNLRQAKIQAISTIIVIFILWGIGIFFLKLQKKSEVLNKTIEENKQLAILGEMASVLAHEIRNPLGSIKGFAQLVLEEVKKNNLKELEEHLSIIVSESKRLESLSDDLLLYAKTKEYKIQNINLKEIIEECIKSISANIDKKEIDFKISMPKPLFLKSDYDKLKQILINIIQNSVDAIPKKGLIHIHTEQKGSQVLVTIEDNGCGMSEEVLSNIFKPFYTTKTKGTGLGLAIVDKLTKSIGIMIHFYSKEGVGTTVKLMIPKEIQI